MQYPEVNYPLQLERITKCILCKITHWEVVFAEKFYKFIFRRSLGVVKLIERPNSPLSR